VDAVYMQSALDTKQKSILAIRASDRQYSATDISGTTIQYTAYTAQKNEAQQV
jgi:hypothetical protein